MNRTQIVNWKWILGVQISKPILCKFRQQWSSFSETETLDSTGNPPRYTCPRKPSPQTPDEQICFTRNPSFTTGKLLIQKWEISVCRADKGLAEQSEQVITVCLYEYTLTRTALYLQVIGPRSVGFWGKAHCKKWKWLPILDVILYENIPGKTYLCLNSYLILV